MHSCVYKNKGKGKVEAPAELLLYNSSLQPMVGENCCLRMQGPCDIQVIVVYFVRLPQVPTYQPARKEG